MESNKLTNKPMSIANIVDNLYDDKNYREELLTIASERCKTYPSREILHYYLEEVASEPYYKHTRAIECFWQEWYNDLLGYATDHSGWHKNQLVGSIDCDFEDIPF